MRRRARRAVAATVVLVVLVALVGGAAAWLLRSGTGQDEPAAHRPSRSGPPAGSATPTPTPSGSPTEPTEPPEPTGPLAMSRPVLSTLGWTGVQQPRVTSITSLAQSEAPGPRRKLHPGRVVRVELRGGETTNTGGYVAPRAEVYGRTPSTGATVTPAAGWPDPPGSVRWYDFAVFVPRSFPTAAAPADGSHWLTFTQWKGFRGGRPPVSLEIRGQRFHLGGANISRDLGRVYFGTWNHFTCGLRLSPDPARGWVQVFRGAAEVVPRTPAATMDVVDGRPDPTYLKQGIYRARGWTRTQVLFFSPMRVSQRKPGGW